MNARIAFFIGVWVMTWSVTSMAQTPATGGGATPTPKSHHDMDLTVVTILKEVHNRGAELYNKGDAVGCYRMYEGSLLTVKAFLAHRPASQKIIDDGLAEVAKTDGAKIQAFRLHEVIEQVRTELKAELKAPDSTVPGPMAKAKEPEATPAPAVSKTPTPAPSPAPAPAATKPDDTTKPNETLPAPKLKLDGPKSLVNNADVSGSVMLAGKPVTNAEITVVSVDLPSPRVFTAKITDGKYKFANMMPTGRYVVIVTGSNDAKIPMKYNTTQTSSVTIEVKAGMNNFDLNLQ